MAGGSPETRAARDARTDREKTREQLREKGTGDWRCGLARKTTGAGDLALVLLEEDAQRERRRDRVVRAKKKKEKGKFLLLLLFFFFVQT